MGSGEEFHPCLPIIQAILCRPYYMKREMKRQWEVINTWLHMWLFRRATQQSHTLPHTHTHTHIHKQTRAKPRPQSPE